MISKTLLPGIHVPYNPLPLSVGETCEYDVTVTTLIILYCKGDGTVTFVMISCLSRAGDRYSAGFEEIRCHVVRGNMAKM